MKWAASPLMTVIGVWTCACGSVPQADLVSAHFPKDEWRDAECCSVPAVPDAEAAIALSNAESRGPRGFRYATLSHGIWSVTTMREETEGQIVRFIAMCDGEDLGWYVVVVTS